MHRIAVRSVPATRLAPDVRISGEVRTPLTWGFLSPSILLPPCALEWSAKCLRSVLEHEREHIRRLDPLSHWLGELVLAAWWFHPFVWLARGRAAHERECACDDAVLRSGVRPTDYASELLNLASTLTTKGEPVMALSALSDFERRIKNLLLPDIDRRPANLRARMAVALATLVVVVPLAVLRAQAPVGQGDLSGTVTDPTGARVPNAYVTASGDHGNREITRAGATGEWTLAGIPAGDYTVEVSAPGFQRSSRVIALAPGQRATVDQPLQVGNVQETINVIGQGQARHTAMQSSGTPERIRVGGNVQATKLLKQVKPVYPESAKAQGIEGTVLMKAIIGKDGTLLSLTVMNKLADPDLAAAALDAAKQWLYQPTLLNGEPVEVVTTITMNFKLQM
jgi:TonB family protein